MQIEPIHVYKLFTKIITTRLKKWTFCYRLHVSHLFKINVYFVNFVFTSLVTLALPRRILVYSTQIYCSTFTNWTVTCIISTFITCLRWTVQLVNCSDSTVTSTAQFANNGSGRYPCCRFKAVCVLGRSHACLVTASRSAVCSAKRHSRQHKVPLRCRGPRPGDCATRYWRVGRPATARQVWESQATPNRHVRVVTAATGRSTARHRST